MDFAERAVLADTRAAEWEREHAKVLEAKSVAEVCGPGGAATVCVAQGVLCGPGGAATVRTT